MTWVALFCVLGALTGTVTGLLPGIHVNVTAAFLAAAAGALATLGVPPLAIAAFIVSLTVAHAFFDIVPTVFLGVPGDESYALLPSQRLVMRGRGLEAVHHALHGSWGGLLGVCALVLVALALGGGGALETAEKVLAPWLGWVLLAVSLWLIGSDSRRGWAVAVFLTSGLLGLIVFSTPLVARTGAFNVLFPALAGLFGLSGLVISLMSREAELPAQEDGAAPAIDGRAVLGGTVGGVVSGLLPGLGSANVATMFSLGGGDAGYLQAVAAINVSDHVMGIAALSLIARPRNGAAAAIEAVMQPGAGDMAALCLVALVVGFACRRALLLGAPALSARVCGLPHRSLTFSVMAFVTVLVTLTTGGWGLALLLAATALGMVAPLAGVRRAHAMGLFLVPVILRYNGWEAHVVTFLHLGQINVPAQAQRMLPALAALLVAFGAAASVYVWAQGRGRWRALITCAGFVAAAMPLWLYTPSVAADAYGAKVIRVKDGDTIVVRRGETNIDIRLADIDCPESHQAFGTVARNRTRELCLEHEVRVTPTLLDKYGRTVGHVVLDDGTELNRRLVEEGLAWVYRKYCNDEALLALEEKARSERRGLWADANPQPPWEFRHHAPFGSSGTPDAKLPSAAAGRPVH